jgi:hypothetical protein
MSILSKKFCPTCGNTVTLSVWTRMAKSDSIQRNMLNGCANDREANPIAYTYLLQKVKSGVTPNGV